MKDFFNPKDVFKTKNLVIMALMVALSAVLGMLTDIYITPNQKLFSFAYLPRAVAAMSYGPAAALVTAFVSDFVTYIAKPTGPYHPGFAVSAMAADFLCAVFLFKQEIKVWRIVLWRALVVVFIFFGLNFMWMNMLYDTSAAGFFTSMRLIRNLLQFPLDVILVYIVGKYARNYLIK